MPKAIITKESWLRKASAPSYLVEILIIKKEVNGKNTFYCIKNSRQPIGEATLKENYEKIDIPAPLQGEGSFKATPIEKKAESKKEELPK